MDTKILLAVLIGVCHFMVSDTMLLTNKRPVPPPTSNGPITNGVFQQIVDHSDDDDDETFDQRYFSNNEFVRSDDHPIFLLVDGEYTSDPGWLHGGQWNDWARKYGAMMFELEHRFFGASLPRSDLSVENLKLLTTDNALADIRYFIEKMNEMNNYSSKNKWVLFGGSYPGVLAAWSRLNSPDLVSGAIASSAPISAVINFSDFYGKGVPFGLEYFSPGCGDSTHEGLLALQSLLESSDEDDVQTARDKFQICYMNTTNWLDRAVFFHNIMSVIGTLVQMNSPYKYEETITFACKTYLNNQDLGEPIDRLAAYMTYKGEGCPNPYVNEVASGKVTTYDPNNVARQWMFLMCHEFGWFMTSEDKSSFVGDTLPLDFYIQECQDIFGPEYNLAALEYQANYLNSYHQGTNIDTTNIVFIHGNIDPYHYAGIVKHPTQDMPYILVDGTAHTQDMYNSMPSDPQGLKSARKIAEESIGKWLSEP